MQVSSLIATAAFLAVVPGAIALAYLGHSQGYYPYLAVPIAVGVLLVVAFAGLFALLPAIRRFEDRSEG